MWGTVEVGKKGLDTKEEGGAFAVAFLSSFRLRGVRLHCDDSPASLRLGSLLADRPHQPCGVWSLAQCAGSGTGALVSRSMVPVSRVWEQLASANGTPIIGTNHL